MNEAPDVRPSPSGGAPEAKPGTPAAMTPTNGGALSKWGAARPAATLRRLFLTVFLRGHSARGLQKDKAPKSLGSKLAAALLTYGLLGFMSCFMIRQPVLVLAIYQHAMTFFLLGVFIAASAGEVLFNPQEADILLHRPVEPRALLWAKVRVLVEVSLWVAVAFNLVGMIVGTWAPDGNYLFALVHGGSIVLEALFVAGCVVLVYQLCLRWFGRERLEGLMTTAQVVLTAGMVLAGQLLPRAMTRVEKTTISAASSWWMWLIPPAWLAGMDDALAGSGAARSWLMAGLAVAVTACVLWASFGKLARDYEIGLQRIGERPARSRAHRRSRIGTWVDRPPLSWLLRDRVVRSSFLLTAAYLARDRDVKLRFYPGLAPMVVLPIVMLFPGQTEHQTELSGFLTAFVTSFMAVTPILTMNILQHSQQWAASDVFRAAPLLGPAKICAGARMALMVLVVAPMVIVYASLLYVLAPEASRLFLLLPGLISLPVFALLPNLGGRAVPLSQPPEEAKSATRGLVMLAGMLASMALAGIATVCWSLSVYVPFLAVEVAIMALVYALLRRSLEQTPWQSAE